MSQIKEKLYFWRDPEGVTSSIGMITDVPYECFEADGYELIDASDFYDDGNNGFIYGVHIGTYNGLGESINIVDVEWFKTEAERKAFVALELSGVPECSNISENIKSIYEFDEDTIFEFDGGTETTNRELFIVDKACGFLQSYYKKNGSFPENYTVSFNKTQEKSMLNVEEFIKSLRNEPYRELVNLYDKYNKK